MNIKELVFALTKKHKTNDPFRIAAERNTHVLYEPLGSTMGYFSQDFRFKFIHINQDLPKAKQIFVCSHELAHSILHPHINTPFLKMHTLFSTEKIERQANIFAVELLIPDKLLQEYSSVSVYDIAAKIGIPPKLIELKSIK